mmetsp:Transcript_1077/g.1125  ORF Transcript_1077/g.1125 Transcript_1077/m.1125 type:complete len:194 (+) Transcript_1077:91-672(+)
MVIRFAHGSYKSYVEIIIIVFVVCVVKQTSSFVSSRRIISPIKLSSPNYCSPKVISEQEKNCILSLGFNDKQLLLIDNALESVSIFVPVLVLGKSDLNKSLGSLLEDQTVQDRDHVIPKDHISTNTDTRIIFFSGFRENLRQGMSVIRATCQEQGLKPPLFALAVPNALNQSIQELSEGITRDHQEHMTSKKK